MGSTKVYGKWHFSRLRAAMYNDLDQFEKLLARYVKQGYPIDYSSDIYERGRLRRIDRSLLGCALYNLVNNRSEKWAEKAINLLLDAGADVNKRNGAGKNAIIALTSRNKLYFSNDLWRKVIFQTEDLNVKDDFNKWSAIDHLCYSYINMADRADIYKAKITVVLNRITLLLEAGADTKELPQSCRKFAEISAFSHSKQTVKNTQEAEAAEEIIRYINNYKEQLTQLAHKSNETNYDLWDYEL